ncbi:prepilin-type N-terminal cleavage/methylation domain-containing protein [Petrocella sp. FN5]|uniref:prepilin-type N-terminal cleavage/methylation domain-containing protein n=1 Tax=Petrocella sp. FN5 TaxID=3032002 RepID=UPI0023DA5B48|nr:prepilin-type N-terminal cleavage/methylation domain-containing protein [Petrocella sp. FN5]MDF1617024.1 prepilin-type N-terminal cleavage/methylation domain-containing protein [Petrocella sp. FN5]
MNNNKGFTTIELILAIAIAGIIMGAVGTYLTFNLKGFNATKSVIDIQYEGQLAMNQLTAIAKESKGIEAIEDQAGNSSIDSPDVVINPSMIIFHQEDPIEGTIEYEITYDPSTQELTCTITPDGGASSSYIMASRIEQLRVAPTNNIDFEYTKSIQIFMDMLDGDAKMSLQSQVKFRNYEK